MRPAHPRFAIFAAFPIAMLLALISATGILHPAIYAREAPALLEQAIGQDWFDLVFAAPLLAVGGLWARGGSRVSRVLLAGGYAYTVYELLIYAFAIHFNALFLVYCTALGLATFALFALIADLGETVPQIPPGPSRLAGGFLVAIGAVFGLLWLSEDLPALLRGGIPASVVGTDVSTNPVHVIDYAFALPAHVLAGVWLWRRRRAGELYAPIVLAFGVPMTLSIGSMMLVIRMRGGEASLPVMLAFFAVAGLTAGLLAHVLVGIRIKRERLAH